MLGLNQGETFLLVFILVAVLTARFWPAAGAWVARRISSEDDARPADE